MSPRAIIETSLGMITAELYADQAPGTVDNFMNLANAGFYRNMIFHRIIKDFVIQTGDPTGTGRGGSDRKINLETTQALTHVAGALGMARGPDRNSASSQFYICDSAVPGLDGEYAVFGKVVEGMEVVHAIASVPTDTGERPLDPPKLLSVSIQ
jgi:peptidyl-prolyl cis-trans isomerase B (cyclophilin B)